MGVCRGSKRASGHRKARTLDESDPNLALTGVCGKCGEEVVGGKEIKGGTFLWR